ncbi:MAG: 4Fe-4S binding protein [Treponema sp.]|nr:4Fe-4S binding protein [Treponema sp.]
MGRKRIFVQVASSLLSNLHLSGLFEKTIYKGGVKNVCLPALNCHSCPLASAACPVGAFQSVANSHSFKLSFFVTGLLSLFGLLLGRFVCGWLCPFGLVQGLLHKIPLPKLVVNRTADRLLRFLKYAVLAVFVIIIPVFVADEFGLGYPAFCKYICPAGTLEAGIPLLLMNKALRATVGFLFRWKLFILLVTILLSLFIYRPFCKYVCPLGAFYSFFNRISLVRIRFKKDKCISCGKCQSVCPMQVRLPEKISSAECIRCGKCVDACAAKALSF